MTLKQIRERVRKLIRLSKGPSYSDSELDAYINEYYVYVMPTDLILNDLYTTYSFITSDGDSGSYTIPEAEESVTNYITVDGVPIYYWLDVKRFYAEWPEDTTHTAGEPTHALRYGNQLILRPPPDDTYTVEMHVLERPDALSTDTSTPTNEKWSKLIALGAAQLVLEDSGDDDLLVSIQAKYAREKALITSGETRIFGQTRSVPRF